MVKDITVEIDVTKDLLHVLRSELENLETEIADMEGEFSVL
jgi:archaellum component FlaC